jgi:coenzyme F420 biosynthesis associated uncharacterized protein
VTDPIPWSLAERVAGRVAGTHPLADTYHRRHLMTTLDRALLTAASMVGEETRLITPGVPEVLVVSRADWTKRNLSAFALLLAPLEHQLAASATPRTRVELARRAIAVETGALLGFLSRRVLGQYELVLPTGEDGDSVAFVGANILELERRHQFSPLAFRLWICLHEATHRAQFTGVPWLRGYFLGLVEELVAHSKPDPGRLAKRLAHVAASVGGGRPVLDESGLFGLFASPAQREVLDRVQALMSVLEGHGHVVMNRIGAREVAGQARMAEVLRLRSKDQRTSALFRLTGIEMKLRQYELGQRFVLAVEAAAGWSALDRVWEGPEWLPTIAEIKEPDRWLQRAA